MHAVINIPSSIVQVLQCSVTSILSSVSFHSSLIMARHRRVTFESSTLSESESESDFFSASPESDSESDFFSASSESDSESDFFSVSSHHTSPIENSAESSDNDNDSKTKSPKRPQS
jgi:hypothetical protein